MARRVRSAATAALPGADPCSRFAARGQCYRDYAVLSRLAILWPACEVAHVHGSGENSNCSSASWYIDGDNDGWGKAGSTPMENCRPTPGWVRRDDDCDDGNSAINPGVSELCASVGVDDNCDGVADEHGASDEALYYADWDADGYGAAHAKGEYACVAPVGKVADHTDCNDASGSTHPGAYEYCTTAADDDCDGDTNDDGALSCYAWWTPGRDGDGLAVGEPSSCYCSPPAGPDRS